MLFLWCLLVVVSMRVALLNYVGCCGDWRCCVRCLLVVVVMCGALLDVCWLL